MSSPFERYLKQGLNNYMGTPNPKEAAQASSQELTLEEELARLLNRYCKENESGTPDFILADYLAGCLRLFEATIKNRAQWRGESVELPALQKLLDRVTTVPAVVWLDDERHEIGQAEVKVSPNQNILWGLISEVSVVVEDGKTTKDLYRDGTD